MSILSVDQIQPIGSGTTITLNATEVKTGTEITVGTGASIFSPAGNTLALGTNNVEALRIKNDGFIGAGTANPRRHFHLHNSASATVGFQMTNGNTGESNDSQGFQLKVGSDSHAEISQMENSDLRIFTNAIERLRINSTGEVGINMTPSNGQMMAITGRSGYDDIVQVTAVGTNMGARINLTNTGNGVSRINATNNSLALQTGGNERLRIDGSGRIFIGTTPQGRLCRMHISGDNFPNAAAGGSQVPLIVSNQDEDYGLQIGAFSSGKGFLQATRNDGTATVYNIQLNPSGGNVEIPNGNLVIGTAGKGIDFSAQTATSVSGASATAEILDHYEEGTWTPFYQNVSTPNYGHRSGTYTRIGRAVHCQFQLSVDSGLDNSDGSAVNIGGLPFTGNSAHESVVFSFGKLTNIMSNARLAEVTNFRFGGNFVMLHRGSNYDINYTLLNSSGHLQAAFTYQMS